MAPVYTYLAADLLTNNILNELPLYSVSFDRQMNKSGNFQASTNLDHERIDNDDMLAATIPGRTALYVYRDDQIVWGGILWSRTYQSQAKSVQITGQTFESYAYRRVWRPSATLNLNEAQSALINDIWWFLQNDDDNCAIGVDTIDPSALPAGDVVRQLTVNPWDFKFYGNYLDDLMTFDDSADFTIEVYEVNGIPWKQLHIGYPRLGASADYTQLNADYPGNTINYYWSESASSGNTGVYATGDGDGSDVKVGVSRNSPLLAAGWPLIENVYQHQGVTVQATIDAHAGADLAAAPMPVTSPTIEIKGDDDPQFGTYNMGDDCRILIAPGDPRFPNGLDTVARVVGWNVTPSGSDDTEVIDLVIQGSSDGGTA